MAIPHLPRGGSLRIPNILLRPLRPRGRLLHTPNNLLRLPTSSGWFCTFCTAQKVRKKARPFVFSGCGVVCSLNHQTPMPIPSARIQPHTSSRKSRRTFFSTKHYQPERQQILSACDPEKSDGQNSPQNIPNHRTIRYPYIIYNNCEAPPPSTSGFVVWPRVFFGGCSDVGSTHLFRGYVWYGAGTIVARIYEGDIWFVIIYCYLVPRFADVEV